VSARARHPSAAELDRLDLLAIKGQTTVAVCLPARDEEATVGAIVAAIHDDLVSPGGRHGGLVDELLVVDDRSVDDTAAAAAAAGARVVSVGEILPEAGSGSGKGNVLWKSLAATTSELVVWCDADLRNFDSRFVSGVVAPLLLDPDIVMVKGFYDRILGDDPTGGGRTTELVARPLLSLLFPDLAHLRQPLGGEYAARRRVLEQLPFAQGYGVEMGLLIDIARRFGVHRITEVDLGQRAHRNRPLQELSAQAMEILQTALGRAGAIAERDGTPVLVRPDLPPVEIEVRERPPLDTIPAYRAARTLV
jgi:glucosyl-3-phosphoglycerate synthase